MKQHGATLSPMNVSHSYPKGVWTAPAPRRPSGSDPLPSGRPVPTRSGLRGEAAAPQWRSPLKHRRKWRNGLLTPGDVEHKAPHGDDVTMFGSVCVDKLTLQKIGLDGVPYEFPVDAGRLVDTKQTLQPSEETGGRSCHYSNKVFVKTLAPLTWCKKPLGSLTRELFCFRCLWRMRERCPVFFGFLCLTFNRRPSNGLPPSGLDTHKKQEIVCARCRARTP